MELAKLEQIYREIIKNYYEIRHKDKFEKEIDYSELVIPFSKLCKSYQPDDIYSGNENIPFNERILEFKKILMQEFSKI